MSAMQDICPDCECDLWFCRCDEFEDDWDCTHCCGDGTCDANSNPLENCDENAHPCHACGGSGKRSDQRIF